MDAFRNFKIMGVSLGGLCSVQEKEERDEEAIREAKRALELEFFRLAEDQQQDPKAAAKEAVRNILGELRAQDLLAHEYQDHEALFDLAAEAAVRPLSMAGASIVLALSEEVPIDPSILTIFSAEKYQNEEAVLRDHIIALRDLDEALIALTAVVKK